MSAQSIFIPDSTSSQVLLAPAEHRRCEQLIPFSCFRSRFNSGQIRSFAFATEQTPPRNALIVDRDQEGQDFSDNAKFAVNQLVPWSDIAETLHEASTFVFPDKESAPLFSPTIYRTGLWFRTPEAPYRGFRCEQNATVSALVVGDADHGLEFDEALARFEAEGVEVILYTTASNRTGDRFRFVVPLIDPVDIATQKQAVLAVCHFLKPGWSPDVSKVNAYSIFYVPGRYPDADNQYIHLTGSIRTAERWISLYPLAESVTIGAAPPIFRRPITPISASVFCGNWNPERCGAIDRYRCLTNNRRASGLFAMMLSLAMSAVHANYQLSASELAALAEDAQRGNPPSNPRNCMTSHELMDAAWKALALADQYVCEPAYIKRAEFDTYLAEEEARFRRDMDCDKAEKPEKQASGLRPSDGEAVRAPPRHGGICFTAFAEKQDVNHNPDDLDDKGESMNDRASTLTEAEELINELAKLSLTECELRIPQAAEALRWSKGAVQRCVKDVRARRTRERKEALRAQQRAEGVSLSIGSDAEVAERVIADMGRDGLYVHSEGSFYRWTGKMWEALDDVVIQENFVMRFDGARYGETARVRMSQRTVKSILEFVAQKIGDKGFFDHKAPGINVQNGFLQFALDGSSYTMVAHDPTQLSRHILPGAYEGEMPVPADSLLARFLRVIWKNDPEAAQKTVLLQELAGAALIGVGKSWLSQPRCVVLFGRSAGNGKSEFLALLEGLVGGCSHVAAHQFDEPNIVINLRGQLLNTASELTSAQAIASETFKQAITGEVIHGKYLYRDVVEFRPQAAHFFAVNRLPPFMGGIDRGCRRRLLVLPFLHSIDPKDMIPDVASKILAQEYSIVLNWAVQGAARLIRRNGFSEPASSTEAMAGWIRDTDPVAAWVDERVRLLENSTLPGYRPSDAMGFFYTWAETRHYDKRFLPRLPEFCHRMTEMFPTCRRDNRGNRFKNIIILSSDAPDINEDLALAPPVDYLTPLFRENGELHE